MFVYRRVAADLLEDFGTNSKNIQKIPWDPFMVFVDICGICTYIQTSLHLVDVLLVKWFHFMHVCIFINTSKRMDPMGWKTPNIMIHQCWYTKNQWVQTTTLGKRHHEIQTSDTWTLETNSLKRTWKLMGMEDDPFFLYLGLFSGGELWVSCGVFFGTQKWIHRSTVVAFMRINRSNVATLWGHHLRSISKSARVTADFCCRRDGLGEHHFAMIQRTRRVDFLGM